MKQRFRTLFGSGALTLALFGTSAAGPDEAVVAEDLCMRYYTGYGVAKDIAKALECILGLAKNGNMHAQISLGNYYYDGIGGLQQDYVEAEKWYRKAAEQGLDYAQAALARMYRDGNGVPQDYVLAHVWFNLAAAHGGAFSEDWKQQRDRLASQMSPAQIAEAQRLAREWKPK